MTTEKQSEAIKKGPCLGPEPHQDRQSLIAKIKNNKNFLHIPIHDLHQNRIGSIVPLCVGHLGDEALVERFVRWRNQNREGWLDQRPVTAAATRLWLEKVVRDPTRMSFLLYFGDQLIGRAGFLNLTAMDNESDGLVRGERGGGFYFIRDAQVSIIDWQFQHLGIDSIWSKVLSSNERALASCRSLGYDMNAFDRRPVYRVHHAEGDVLSDERQGERCFDLELLYFRLARDQFYRSLEQWKGG